jgi:hypothetical protein
MSVLHSDGCVSAELRQPIHWLPGRIAPIAKWMLTSLLSTAAPPLQRDPLTPNAVRSIVDSVSNPTKSPQPGRYFSPRKRAGIVK